MDHVERTKRLTAARYQRIAERHPWWPEAQRFIEAWNAKVDDVKARGGHPRELFENYQHQTLEDEVGFARLLMRTPDMRWFYEDKTARERFPGDMKAKWADDFSEIYRAFLTLYFGRRGLPNPIGIDFVGADTAVWHHHAGLLPDVDGPEARALMEQFKLGRNMTPIRDDEEL